MVKHIIAYIFLFVLSVQVLPVKEIGKILYNGVAAEEQLHTCENDADDFDENLKLKKVKDPVISSDEEALCKELYLALVSNTALEMSDCLFVTHKPDVLTPPPNYRL